MDVAVWLRGLGLQRYEALFRENDIDAKVLGDLTDGDLEKIGVSLGHRKRLLKPSRDLLVPRRRPGRRHSDSSGRRRRRASPTHGDVFRSRGLDRAVGAARSGGHARGHSGLSVGFVSGDPATARLDKLEAMIARSGLDAEDLAPLLASLPSISFEGRYPALEK